MDAGTTLRPVEHRGLIGYAGVVRDAVVHDRSLY
jgi:hypothetical protein